MPSLINQRRQSGYLLLEVLLAIAILSIVVVMIFQIVQNTLRATAQINFLQTEQRKIDGIQELFRRNFLAMPITCQFQTQSADGRVQLVFRHAPFNFSWSRSGVLLGTVTIAGRTQPDGRIALGFFEEPEAKVVGQEKGDWILLLGDIDQLTWRFYDTRTGKWLLEWSDAGYKPKLVELSLKLSGRSHLERGVFRWPAT